MKRTKVCPKCGGQDIAVMRSDLMVDRDPRVRTSGGLFLNHQDFLPVERYLCCTCGYMESWVDAEAFVQKGGKKYWEEQMGQSLDELDAYWKEQLRLKREKEAQEEHAREKEKKNRRDDPWT